MPSRKNSYHIVINEKAGRAQDLGRAEISRLVEEAFADQIASLNFSNGDTLAEIIDCMAEEEPLPFLIGGGDGTVISAAEILLQYDLPFGVLPLGTMNLLANDLGLTGDFATALEQLKNAKTEYIDVGLLNDRIFLCSAVLGALTETAVEREKVRQEGALQNWPEFISALSRGLFGETTHSYTLEKEGQTSDIEASVLVVSNNRFLRKPENQEERIRRESLTDGLLAVYTVLSESAIDGLSLLFKLWRGDWQEHEHVYAFETDSLTVHTRESNVLVTLDGEPVTMDTPIDFSIDKRALPVLVPGDKE